MAPLIAPSLPQSQVQSSAAERPVQTPLNDDLVDATVVSSLPFHDVGTTLGATNEQAEVSEDCADIGAPGVWYRLHLPAESQSLRIDTNGDNEIDTVLSVWTGTGHPLEQVACNDDVLGSVWSAVVVTLIPGQQYFARVAGYGGEEGSFEINVTLGPRQATNDDLADAVEISELPFADSVSVGDLTDETDEELPSCGSGGGALWYRYAADTTANLAFSGSADAGAPSVSIWTGSEHPLTEVACAERASDGSPLVRSVAPGEVLFVRVSVPELETFTQLDFRVGPAGVAPANDEPEGAAPIGELPDETQQLTTWATDGATEPRASCAQGAAENGVWYRYEPSEAHRLAVRTEGTNYSAIVSLWRADDVGVLHEIDCRMDEAMPAMVLADTIPGETLLIKLSGRGGSRGTLRLQAWVADPPPNDDLANALVVASLPFTHTEEAHLSTAEPGEMGSSCHDPTRNRGIWYELPSGVGDRVAISTIGFIPILISAWTGGPDHPLTEVGCGNNAIMVEVVGDRPTFVRLEPAFRLREAPAIEVRFSAPAPPPPNDARERAIVIPALPYTDRKDMSSARPDTSGLRGSCEPFGAGSAYAIWYRYTPQSSADLIISATGGDLYVTVWLDDAGPATQVACGRQRVVQQFSEGETYLIRLATPTNPPANVMFEAMVVRRPDNDDLANASPIGSLPFSDTVNTSAATAESAEPASECGPTGERGVWYRFAPDFDAVLVVDTRGSEPGFDTVLSAWSGPVVPAYPLTPITCNDDFDNRLWSQIEVSVGAGEVVYIRAGGLGSATGTLVVAAHAPTPPPSNDDLDSAMLIGELVGFRDERVTESATREELEQISACNDAELGAADRTVWYRFEPTESMSATLTTDGSDFDTVLSVWTGGPDHPLDEMTCNDDMAFSAQSIVSFVAEPGGVYYVQATGLAGDSGNLVVLGPEPPAQPVVYLPMSMTR